jgi:hypothetical protein
MDRLADLNRRKEHYLGAYLKKHVSGGFVIDSLVLEPRPQDRQAEHQSMSPLSPFLPILL